jgi:hypothetical protein
MSEITIEQLQAELNTVKNELMNARNMICFNQAQLESQKEFINELLASTMQLRTNLHIVRSDNIAKDNIIKQKDALLEEKDKQIASLTPKIE